MRQELKQDKGKIYCVVAVVEGTKYVVTAFWPEGSHTEIVASGCQAGVAAFTPEQTFPDLC